MLLFSAKIPVIDTMTEQQFIDLCAEWLYESPHYHRMRLEYDLSGHKDHIQKEKNITVFVSCHKDESISIVGFRLEKNEPNARWFADYLYIEENGRKYVMVQNSRDTTAYSAFSIYQKKPHIVKQLIQKGYAAVNGAFPISEASCTCTDERFATCVSYMKGESCDDLPLVYVSCTRDEKLLIDADHLAFELAGRAYVVTEPDKRTSLHLKECTDGQNPYNGAIGVYYPQSNRYEIFSPKFKILDALENEIVQAVSKRIASHIDASHYSWAQLQVQKSRAKVLKLNLNAQENQELREFNDVILENEAVLTAKINALNEEISELKRKNESIKMQLNNARNPKKQTGGTEIILHTSLQDLYNNEQHDCILRTLHTRMKAMQQNPDEKASRRYEILKDIIEHNQEHGEGTHIREELKRLLKAGFKWSRDKSRIVKLGFKVVSENDHAKTTFHDTKYQFNFPKTPSDFHGPENLCHEIIRGLGLD